MLRLILLSLVALISWSNHVVAGQDSGPLTLTSPSGTVMLKFATGDQGQPTYDVVYKQSPVITASALGLVFKSKKTDTNWQIKKHTQSSHNLTWKPFVGERAEIKDAYKALHVELQHAESKLRLDLQFRVYDEGVAFCYTIPEQSGLTDFVIERESTEFRFASDFFCWSRTKVEGEYTRQRLSEVSGVIGRPLVVEFGEGAIGAIGEARLVDYARMQLKRKKNTKTTIEPKLDGVVTATASFVTPWRYLMLGDSPGALMENNDLVVNLNDPCAIQDTSWIKPGKVFRTALSTAGAKEGIDFAAKMNLQHVLLDAGWYGSEFSNESDATTVTVDPKRAEGPLDMQAVVDYGAEKGIGVFLYVNRRCLERQLDDILPLFKKWGVAGIKFGFVNVGSQKWTKWVHDSVKKCAEYQIMVDIHDKYLPTGWSRTYPNLLTQEGVGGNEQMPTAEHNVTLPFTRFLCGPADYTVCYFNGRIKTTRAHQLAASIVYFSPMQLLFWYDRPSQYHGEPELDVFKQLKTTWDDTSVVHGEIGKFITVARRSGDQWFVGSMNAHEQRSLEIPLTFLEPGKKYEAAIYSDQDPSGEAPKKVDSAKQMVTSQSVITAEMARNGGQAIVITPLD